MATLATIIPGCWLAPSSSSRPQCGCSPGRSLRGSFGGEMMRRAVTLRSRPWRSAAAYRAMTSSSDEISTPPPDFVADQPQVFYFAIANAQSLMLEGVRLEVVLQDGIERAERAKRPRDVWLIMEPAFLNQHPGLKALNAQLTKPTAAILSTNADWMLSYVKKSLPQAVIGKFTSPSTAVPDPLKSSLNANSDVVGGRCMALSTTEEPSIFRMSPFQIIGEFFSRDMTRKVAIFGKKFPGGITGRDF